MKTTNLTLAIESEKLSALKQYAAKKDISLETELADAVDKLYDRLVPQAVREYLAEREPPAPGRPPRPSRAPSSATGE